MGGHDTHGIDVLGVGGPEPRPLLAPAHEVEEAPHRRVLPLADTLNGLGQRSHRLHARAPVGRTGSVDQPARVR